MTWDRVAPPYKFFQLAAWESNETDGKYLLVERQAGPDVRDWEVNIVTTANDPETARTVDTFENEEDARQAAEEYISNY